jgi:hypothetical protein
MATIADIRKQYPQYNDLSDEQLAQGFHQKFYSDIPYDQFKQQIGITTPVAKPPSTAQQLGSAFVEQLPAIGAVAAPVITTLATGGAGLPLALGTAGVGAAAGETIKQMIQGKTEPDVARIGQEAALGMAGEGFGQALGPVVRGAAGLAKGVLGLPQQTARQLASLEERQVAQQLLQRQGATLSAGQVGGTASQLFEGLSRAGLGEGAFAANQKAIGTALQNEKNQIVSSIGNANLDAVEAGKLLTTTLDAAGDAFSTKIAPFYDRILDKKGAAVLVDTKPVAVAASKIVTDAQALSKSGKTAMALDPEDLAQLNRFTDTAESMTFKQAHDFRSGLLRQSRILETKYGQGTPLAKTINEAVDTINKQMDSAALEMNPQLQKEYRAVSAEYKRAMSTLYDESLVSLLQKNPEKIGDAIGQSGNMTEALKVKKALRFAKEQNIKGTDEIFDNFLSGYLQSVFKSTGDEAANFARLGDKLANDPKFNRTFYTVLADKPVVKENIKNLINAAKIAERENKPTILSGMFGTGAQGAIVTGAGAAALGTPVEIIGQIAAAQAAGASVLTNKAVTNTLLRAEEIAQKAGQTKAYEYLSNSKVIQRFLGQEVTRAQPVSEGLLSIPQAPTLFGP